LWKHSGKVAGLQESRIKSSMQCKHGSWRSTWQCLGLICNFHSRPPETFGLLDEPICIWTLVGIREAVDKLFRGFWGAEPPL
jgi:hypothetical protein